MTMPSIERAIVLAGIALALSGCLGSETDSGSVTVVGASEKLAVSDVESLNGTYGTGCIDEGEPWSIAVADGAALSHDALHVVLNDADCELLLTEVVAQGQVYAADTPL